VGATVDNDDADDDGNVVDDDDDDDDDDDFDGMGLILMSLPPGVLTYDDLVRSDCVYVLGGGCEGKSNGSGGGGGGGDSGSGSGSIIEPVAARLIVEGIGGSRKGGGGGGGGKTLELTRVETSNTYVVVPPMPHDRTAAGEEGGSNKRRRLLLPSSVGDDDDAAAEDSLVTMPARSVGRAPGQGSPSCFFLEPRIMHLGHIADALRGELNRAIYDPFDPPPPPPPTAAVGSPSSSSSSPSPSPPLFGRTVAELARACRASEVEVRDAVGGRTFGAEDAMALPWSYSSPSSSSSSSGEGEGEGGGGNPVRRYATLSEEGRRTVSSAIVSALIEYDSDLAWADNTSTTGDDDDDEEEEEEAGNDGGKMRLSSLIDEVRARWRRSEGDDDDARPDLADVVVWHCLRPAVRRRGAAASASSASSSAGGGGGADDMPTFVRLLPDEVAGLCAHEAFLGAAAGQRVAEWWREEELLEAWSTRLPSMPSGYEPRTGLLRGVAVCRTTTVEEGGDDDDGDGEDGDATEDDRGGAIVSRRSRRGGGGRRWRYFPEAGLPSDPALRIGSMFAVRDAWTAEEATPYLEKFAVASSLSSADGDGGDDGKGSGKSTRTAVVDLLGRYARATTTAAPGGVSVTKYVAKR
jgi:hypothetical protein